jgi:hypothetical protein
VVIERDDNHNPPRTSIAVYFDYNRLNNAYEITTVPTGRIVTGPKGPTTPIDDVSAYSDYVRAVTNAFSTSPSLTDNLPKDTQEFVRKATTKVDDPQWVPNTGRHVD